MGFIKRVFKVGITDEIRCDEPSYLIWKWRPKGFELGEHDRENSIRLGSTLRVKDGEIAVFVYKQKDGTLQDFIEGPFDRTIVSGNLPFFSNLPVINNFFQAEVYFINLAGIIQSRFAVPYFDIFDPRALDFAVPVAIRGTITFRINDYKEFIKLHRLIDFDFVMFERQIRDSVTRYVKETITNIPYEADIPVIQLERKTSEINSLIEQRISARLKKDFGVDISGIDLESIEIDKASEGYRDLMSITKERTSSIIRQQTVADMKNIEDKQRIESRNYEESLRVMREEGQYGMRKGTQSSNMGAYQIEKQAEVGVAGANALGNMGSNGAGNVDLGNGCGGFNPAAMMAGMALGGAVGQNISNTMNSIMPGVNNPPAVVSAPPPIPIISYFVVINGQSTGPYDLNTLTQMVISGTLSRSSLVWKQGMSNWIAAEKADDLKDIFSSVPPDIN